MANGSCVHYVSRQRCCWCTVVDVLRTQTDSYLMYDRREEHNFWRKFDFLPQWGMLSHSEKLAKLRDHACHELHFFVQQRDPELFQSTVLPLLQVHCG